MISGKLTFYVVHAVPSDAGWPTDVIGIYLDEELAIFEASEGRSSWYKEIRIDRWIYEQQAWGTTLCIVDPATGQVTKDYRDNVRN